MKDAEKEKCFAGAVQKAITSKSWRAATAIHTPAKSHARQRLGEYDPKDSGVYMKRAMTRVSVICQRR